MWRYLSFFDFFQSLTNGFCSIFFHGVPPFFLFLGKRFYYAQYDPFLLDIEVPEVLGDLLIQRQR